jgi:hypothetical protein
MGEEEVAPRLVHQIQRINHSVRRWLIAVAVQSTTSTKDDFIKLTRTRPAPSKTYICNFGLVRIKKPIINRFTLSNRATQVASLLG